MSNWTEQKNIRFYLPKKYINSTVDIQYFNSTATSTDYKISSTTIYFPKSYTIDSNSYDFPTLHMASGSNYTLANFKKQTLQFIFRDTTKDDYTVQCFNNLKLFHADSSDNVYEVDTNAYSINIDKTTYANYYYYVINIDCSKLGTSFYNMYSASFTPVFILPLGYNVTPVIYRSITTTSSTGVKTSEIPTTIVNGESVTWNITTFTGYKISSISINDDNFTYIISEDNRSATIQGTISQDLSIEILATSYPTYQIINDSVNLQTFSSQTKFEYGDSFNIKITCKPDHEISYLKCNQIIHNITYNSDKSIAYITGTVDSNITIAGEALQKKYVTITGTLTNCSCNYTNGELVNKDKQIIITANSGYEFLNDSYTASSGTATFIKSVDNTTLTINPLDYSETTIYGEIELISFVLDSIYTATRQYDTVNQFVSSYIVTPSILAKIAKGRYSITTSDSDGNESTTYFDYGTFITSLYRHYIELPFEDYVTGNIILGTLDTNISTSIYTTDYIEYSLGAIEILPVFNDFRDFNNSYVLHCPYMDEIQLSNHYCIGHTLTLKARLDLYTGYTTILVYSSFNNLCVLTHSFNNSTHIPFIQSETQDALLSYSNTVFANVTNKAFVECIHAKIDTNSYTKYEADTLIYDTIGNYKGYTVIKDIDIESHMTTEELSKLKDLLKEGVFINE